MSFTDGKEIVTLTGRDDEEIDFYLIDRIMYMFKQYAILQPVDLLDGMEENEVLVFRIKKVSSDVEDYEIVLDDRIVDAVLQRYNKRSW